ncbi:MAG: hypothetical protein R2759_04680 [Bacteroidales bacterium]
MLKQVGLALLMNTVSIWDGVNESSLKITLSVPSGTSFGILPAEVRHILMSDQ